MIPKPNGVPGTTKNRALEPSYHFQVTSDITDISRITQRWAKVEDNRGKFPPRDGSIRKEEKYEGT